MKANLPDEMANSGDSSSLGIDNVCLHIDKYLDDLEKSMDIANSTLRRSSSFGFPSTSASDEKNWSTVSKQSMRRYSLDNDLNKKENNWKNASNLDVSEPDINKPLRLCWRNLSYSVEDKMWSSSICPVLCGEHLRKIVLDRQSGEICSGQLTAIIGPSGAGKSTLLESLAGRRKKGLKGEVLTVFDPDFFENASMIKIAFIGQKDEVIKVLTVRETLYFATRIKNYGRIKNCYYHQRLVKSILKELSLETCADIRVSQISGGQLKRLSFAVELISGPDILMLDEPTSGLDSSSAFQCILLLRKLTDLQNKELSSKAPAILCSIHQPSARVLNIFHQIYVLSFDGRCLYSGPPSQLIDYLSKLGLQCPQFHNPADFIIEIASSDYGADAVNKLAIAECNRQVDFLNDEKMLLSCNKFLITTNGGKHRNHVRVPVTKVIQKLKNQSFPHFRHTWLLLRRTYLSTIRDPKLTWFRITQAIFIALLMSYLYDYPIGKADGCLLPTASVNELNIAATAGTQDNISFIFFVTLFTVMASMMPTVLTFPSEVSVLIQERNNGWYSCWVYYWTKVIADSPYQILITIMFCSIIYPMTSQIESYTRFVLFNAIMILVASIAQCVGMLFGTVYVNSVENAVFMAPLSMAPMFLLSGFFGKLSAIPIIMKPIAYISYVKYAFEALLVVLYGLNRCPSVNEIQNASLPQVTANTVNGEENIEDRKQLRFNEEYTQGFPKIWSGYYNPLTYPLNQSDVHQPRTTRAANSTSTSTSLILRHFEVRDETLIENICILVLILIILRFVTYFILLSKSNKKK